MRTRRKISSSKLGFEQLEGRRLLAADFAVSAMADVGSVEPDQYQTAAAEFPVDADVQMDFAEATVVDPAEELAADLVDPVNDGTGEAELIATDAELMATEAVEAEPQQLELSDGMDGYFGSLNAESPVEAIEFSTPADGIASIVMASSFEDGHVAMTITDSNGDIVEADSSSDDAFTTLSFEAEENETYQLTIEALDGDCEGQFQVTVGFQEFVDQHANEIGSQSTELQWTDGQAEVTGKLETAGDVDTFRFAAEGDGEVMLQLNELEDVDRVNLDVQVFDSAGDVIVEGSTNEMLQMSFDVNQGDEYYVSVAAGEGQSGDYSISMALDEAEVTRPNLETPSLIVEAPASETAVEDSPTNPGEESIAEDIDIAESVSETITDSVAEPVSEDAPVAAIDETIADPAIGDIECEPEAVEEPVVEDVIDSEPVTETAESVIEEPGSDSATGDIVSEPEVIDELVDENAAEASVADDVESNESTSVADEALAADDLELPADPGEMPAEVDDNVESDDSTTIADEALASEDEELPVDSGEIPLAIDEPVIPVDESIGLPVDEIPVNGVADNEESVDGNQSLVDDGSLITGEPESGVGSEELETEIGAELTDSPELALVDSVESDSSQAEEPMACFAGVESVDRFFANLGALEADSSLDSQVDFGPFRFLGSDLYFWASTGNSRA